MHHRQFMVEPAPRHTDRQHQRCYDMAQRLVEIGRLLLCNRIESSGKGGARRRSDTIHVTNHRLRHPPGLQQRLRPAIGSDDQRRMRCCKIKVTGMQRRTPDERDWSQSMNNRRHTPLLPTHLATCPKRVTK